MWGIRAIRAGLLACGLLLIIAGAGCCDCCKNLWKSEKAVPTSQPTAGAKGDDKDAEKVLSDWKSWRSSEDQPSHLPPERIHGGIY
jgi:hypothetical protein